MTSLNQHDVLSALDRTYGLLDGSTAWPDCLDILMDLANIHGCSLFLYDCGRGHSQLLEARGSVRSEPGCRNDVAIDDFLWRAAPGSIWSPPNNAGSNNGFNPVTAVRPAGNAQPEAYAVIDRDHTHVLYLAFSGRPLGQPLDRDTRALLDGLLPHLHRACRLQRSIQGQTLLQLAQPDRPPSLEAATLTVELRLRRRFKLSKAEARVAKHLAEGLAPRTIADRLHVSIHTVRSQLQSIFQKTDTCRQAELTSRLLREIEIPNTPCQSQPMSIDNQEHRTCL